MEKTVLITGAGFSKPYGYPSGVELVNQIINKWHTNTSGIHGHLRVLAHDLKDTEAYSIDRFLVSKNSHLKTGITAIVYEILEAEQASMNKNIDANDDIIKFLLNALNEDNFDKIKIITFNYDRHFQWKLFKVLRVLSNSDEEALLRLSKLKIEHIHGRMAPLSGAEAKLLGRDELQYVPYGLGGISIYTSDNLVKVADAFAQESFKTIFTNDNIPNQFAVNAIKEAKRVFFLGFSFDDKNMTKLGINVEGIRYDWPAKYVAGTSYGVEPVDLNKIYSDYNF